MHSDRPSSKDLAYIGFSELQIILINASPANVANEAYRLQLESLMTDEDILDI